ncbi:flagellar biosynthesis anti-sigma factor FlgM [Ectothiorhodospira shaposhnikovii]|nr:flagellar biosynthesis anti-sigma factor FlgM [Ectothiorhodospira shaposhnikovii]MBK1673458.1 flagellar biosynthesis anti-sigma factor FlgM [Ectothiorhodospira shaposhnikovii]
MSIDIKSLTQSQTRGAGDSRGASDVSRPGSNSSASKTTAPEGDKVTLTETARRLTNFEQNAKAQPTVDQEKVAAIRQAIQEGRYQVNADSVAGNIMKNEALYPL